MNAPKLATTHPLVTAVANQLLTAIQQDQGSVGHTPFGPHAMLVIAEIVSAAVGRNTPA